MLTTLDLLQLANATTRVKNIVRARHGMMDVRMNVHVITLLRVVTAVTISKSTHFRYKKSLQFNLMIRFRKLIGRAILVGSASI